jgi:hypothetical protein
MELKDVSKAINEDWEVDYSEGRYRICGYQVVKNLKGEKNYYLILLDLRNMRTLIQVGINDV